MGDVQITRDACSPRRNTICHGFIDEVIPISFHFLVFILRLSMFYSCNLEFGPCCLVLVRAALCWSVLHCVGPCCLVFARAALSLIQAAVFSMSFVQLIGPYTGHNGLDK